MTRTTTYTLMGTLTGGLWWPMGAPAAKPVTFTWTREAPFTDAPTLREAVQHVEAAEGGDFSDAPLWTADSVLIIRRASGAATRVVRERVVPLSACPSIAAYVSADRFEADYYPQES